MDKDRRIGHCPHCGNVSTHHSIHEYATTEKDFNLGFQDDTMIPHWYALAVCETCDLPILYFFDEDEICDPEGSNFQNGRVVWPAVTDLTNAVPLTLRRRYLEAARIRRIAPTAYAVQIRSCLEALCDDRGATQGSLYKRLQNLAFKNDIPPVLAEMSEIVRVLGNIGAHETDQTISHYDAKVIDDFFRSIIEYVYEAPKRVQAFRQKLVKFGKSQDEEPPDTTPSSPNVPVH